MNKLAIIIICLILAFVLGFLLVLPKYQNFQILQSNIKKEEKALQAKKEYFLKIKDISEKFKEYEDALVKVSSALPQSVSLPSLSFFLQQTAVQTGLILENIELDRAVESKERIKVVSLTIEVAGTYPAFKNFLLALENSSKIIEVQEISFNSPEEEQEPFSFSLDLKTYSY